MAAADGSPDRIAALAAQLGRLRRLEADSALYRQLLAEADHTIRSGGGYAHGWGEYNPHTEREVGRTHGRIGTYADGCRCDECREAARVSRARSRAKAQQSSP